MPRRPPRHDWDAGGPAELLAAKAALRQDVWRAMREAGVARFPGAEGRIPNFIGAEAAAEALRETGPETPVVTTVHELQVRDVGEIPVAEHDVLLDLVVTPDRTLRCRRGPRDAPGIRWSELTEDKIAAVPLLAELQRDRS